MAESGETVMTAEEEAELLEKYGSSDPIFDALVSVQAPSHFRSIYETRQLFLTTTDDAIVEKVDAVQQFTQLTELDFMAPLEVFTLRHLPASAVCMSSCMSAAVSVCLTAAKGEARQSEGVVVEDAAVLASKALLSKIEREDLHIAPGSVPSLGGTEDDDELNRELQRMIEAAEAEIRNRNFHYDPAADPVFQERLKQLHDQYELAVSPLRDPADDEQLLTDEELRVIQEDVESRPFVPILTGDEREEFEAMCRQDHTADAKRQLRQQMNDAAVSIVAARETAERAAFLADFNVQRGLQEVPSTTMDDILEHIRCIGERDTAMEKIVVATAGSPDQLNASSTASPGGMRPPLTTSAADEGLLRLASDFNAKLDSLLAPASVIEVKSCDGDIIWVDEKKTLKNLQGVTFSVQQIKRKSAREDFLLRRQLAENRLMRIEDDRIQAYARFLEQSARDQEEQISNCKSGEDTGRRAILGEEAIAHVEIVVREERQRSAIIQLVTQRLAQKKAQLLSDLQFSFDQISKGIDQLESCEWCDITGSAAADRAAIVAKQAQLDEALRNRAKRIASELEGARLLGWRSAQTEALQRAKLVSERISGEIETARKSDVHSPLHLALFSGSSRHFQVVSTVSCKALWLQHSKNDIIAVLQGITQALHTAVVARRSTLVGTRKKKSTVPGSRVGTRSGSQTPISLTPSPPPASMAGADDGVDSIILNDRLARKLHPAQFACALADVACAPYVFHSMMFALECIENVDYKSLVDMCVASLQTQLSAITEAMNLRVTPFVRYLDLSCNALSIIDAERLFSCFPSLVDLKLNGNQITSVSKPCTTAQPPSSLTALDISANQLTSLECISGFPELRKLHAFANRLTSLQGIETCTKLRELEISRNRIEKLSGLEGCLTLGTIDISRNEVTSLATLQCNVVVQRLFASSNKISCWPTRNQFSFAFIRQLYLAENSLTEVPVDVMWMPLLAELHLESNKITNLAGLSSCSQLTSLNVSFNQLDGDGAKALSPLLSCRRLKSLAFNDNPIVRPDGASFSTARFVLAAFPLLQEMNSEPVNDDQRLTAKRETILIDWKHSHSLWYHLHGRSVLVNPSVNATSSVVDAFVRFVGCCSTVMCDLASVSSVAKLRVGYGLDIAMDRMQKEFDNQQLHANRRLQSALATEENLRNRMKERGGFLRPQQYHLSVAVSEANYVESMQQSQRHLESLREQPSLDAMFNVHSNSLRYKLRSRQHREARSKSKISSWILGRLLIRRAKKELEVLREASEFGRIRRFTQAALRIQPVWRGAIVRKRLRAFRQTVDDDDDIAFQKVTFEIPDQPIGFGNFSTLFQSALMAHPQAQPFNVIVAQSQPQKGVEGLVRTGSAPGLAGAPQRLSVDGYRPQSNPSIPTESTVESMSARIPTKLDDEWGAALADQIRKKNKKMEKAKQDSIRKEFMHDPLKAKKLLGK